MAKTIVAIPELWTDEIVDQGALSRLIKIHAKVILDNNGVQVTEWHYYGTTVPTPPPAGTVVEHPAIHFPPDIINLESNDILYSMGLEVIVRTLQL